MLSLSIHFLFLFLLLISLLAVNACSTNKYPINSEQANNEIQPILDFQKDKSDKPFLPILLMHGIKASNETLKTLQKNILKNVPAGTRVFSIDCENDLTSIFKNMNDQLKDFTTAVQTLQKQYNFTDHHLICHSQGGLLCRSFIQMNKNHNVKVFISLSGVQNGQFGIPNSSNDWEYLIRKYLPVLLNVTREQVYHILYNKVAQDSISIAGYWRDPYQVAMYESVSSFLAILNNQTNYFDFASHYNYRENVLKIDKMVLTASPQDEVIMPYESAHFGFYYEYVKGYNKDNLMIRPMKDSEIYEKDVFGLKTLDLNNRLIRISVDNVKHNDWIFNEELFVKYMKPYLY
ncbi:hypothetical protein ABK040_011357 [Willaertia magna]